MKKRNSHQDSTTSNFNLSKSKRSQTTIFIIIAIAIIGAIAGGTYVVTKNNAESKEFFNSASIRPTLNSISSATIDCAEQTSRDALDQIGIQGGYNNKPANVNELDTTFVPYYYDRGNYLQPTRTKIEEELSSYVNDNIDSCLESINYEGFQISFTNPLTKTQINEKNVVFNINQPIRVKKDNYKTDIPLNNHQTTINSELQGIINIATFLTESHKEDPSLYCISCVADLAEEDDLYVDILEVGENEMLVIISENHTYSEPYSFEFLNRYTGNEISPSNDEIQEAPPIPQEEN